MTWHDEARVVALELAALNHSFTAEDVTAKAGRPVSPNAIGALFREMAAEGLIHEVGSERAKRADRKGARLLLWAGTGIAQTDMGVALADEPRQTAAPGWTCITCGTPARHEPIGPEKLLGAYANMRCEPCDKRCIFQYRGDA